MRKQRCFPDAQLSKLDRAPNIASDPLLICPIDRVIDHRLRSRARRQGGYQGLDRWDLLFASRLEDAAPADDQRSRAAAPDPDPDDPKNWWTNVNPSGSKPSPGAPPRSRRNVQSRRRFQLCSFQLSLRVVEQSSDLEARQPVRPARAFLLTRSVSRVRRQRRLRPAPARDLLGSRLQARLGVEGEFGPSRLHRTRHRARPSRWDRAQLASASPTPAPFRRRRVVAWNGEDGAVPPRRRRLRRSRRRQYSRPRRPARSRPGSTVLVPADTERRRSGSSSPPSARAGGSS